MMKCENSCLNNSYGMEIKWTPPTRQARHVYISGQACTWRVSLPPTKKNCARVEVWNDAKAGSLQVELVDSQLCTRSGTFEFRKT